MTAGTRRSSSCTQPATWSSSRRWWSWPCRRCARAWVLVWAPRSTRGVTGAGSPAARRRRPGRASSRATTCPRSGREGSHRSPPESARGAAELGRLGSLPTSLPGPRWPLAHSGPPDRTYAPSEPPDAPVPAAGPAGCPFVGPDRDLRRSDPVDHRRRPGCHRRGAAGRRPAAGDRADGDDRAQGRQTGPVRGHARRGEVTPDQILALAQGAGSGGDPVTATAVALAESGGNPAALGQNPDGSRDRGLWQVNDRAHPDVADACAFDPSCNAQAAYA